MKTKFEEGAENFSPKTAEVLRFIVERHAKFNYKKQGEFNSKFKLEENLALGEKLGSYIEKKLAASNDSKKKVKEFLADSNNELQFGNDRSFHGAYHSIITAAYAGMFADFYSKNFAGNFGISESGLTEEQKNMAMILTSAHDIARQHGYLAKDEHNNAFYLALILRDKFGLHQDSAIKWASHIAKKDEKADSKKTIFSRLTQCADCAAIARVSGSYGFDEKFLDAKKDIDESIRDPRKNNEAKNNLKSILDFTKAFEDEMRKGNYGKKLTGGNYFKNLTSFDEAIGHITKIAKSLSVVVDKDPFLKHLESFRAHEPNAAVIKDAGLTIINPAIFPQPNAAEEFNKLTNANRRKISERTRITVTQEEIEHAKRFIALVAITEGETGRTIDRKEISQKKVYEQQGILPYNCLKDCKKGSLEEKINFVAAKITPENIRAFYKRLIEKRPKVFFNPGDNIVQRADTPHKIQNDLNLPEYVGYSEIEFGAMLQVFGATQFINDGGRGNQGKKRVVGQTANACNYVNEYEGYVSGAHEEFGYISAIVGMRLETEDPAMERLHVIEGEREKAIQQYNLSKGTNEKGDFARMRNVKIDFVEGHKLIWDQFYKQNSQQKGGSSTAAGVAFNDEVAKQRLCISYKKFLAESIANAKQDGKKAHIRITGCGDGVWAGHQGAKVKSAIGKAVRMAFNDLDQTLRSQISAIEFCQYGGEDYYEAFFKNDSIKEKEIDGVKIVSSGAKFSDKLKKDKKTPGDKETVLCVNFAWDGGSYVGNEYWLSELFASGDPAAACCSSIAISMNPEINPQFLDKLFVVSKNGIVSEVGGESSTIKVTPKSTEQETKKMKLKEPKQPKQPKPLDSDEEWTKKYGYIAKRKDGLKNYVAKFLTENITSVKQANDLLRDVQDSITRLEEGRGDDAASFLQIDFKRNRVSDSVQEIFFEERKGKVSFKNASFKKGTPNIDALTNVSYLLERHAELVDPHKNLAKKLIKYQLQEIQKIKEGSTDKEKLKNSEERAYKIKTLRNLAVYLGASDNPGHLVIGDRHEDASEFVNLLCDALYESPPFRLEKTSTAVGYEEYRSVKNDPATTLQTELPKAIIKDGTMVFEKTSFQETINAHQKAEILGEELNKDRYRKELQSKYNRTRPKVDFEEFYKFHVESGGLEEYLRSADVVFDTEEGKKKFKTQSQIKAFVSSDVSEIVVSSKRFAFTQEGQGYKLKNEVSLNPITFSVDGGGEGNTKTFHPTAFIIHNGNLQGGHYISYVKESDDKWYCYNDKLRSGPTKISELNQAQKDSYIVKYSVKGTKLPKAQVGANNLTGNMCWANATAALMASCSSLLNDEIVLTKEERGILDSDLARGMSGIKGASRDLPELSKTIEKVISQEIPSHFGSSLENSEGSYLDDKTLEETELDLLKSEQEYFSKNISNPNSYYDFQILNFAINANAGERKNVKLVEFSTETTHKKNLKKGIENFFDESLALRGLVIPMRSVFYLKGISQFRGHFTGLYVTKKEDESIEAVYIDPTGEGKKEDIPQYVMDELRVFKIDRDDIKLTTNKIQHCTKPRVHRNTLDNGTFRYLKIDASPTNVHCGAFIADILSGLISGEKSINNCKIQSKTDKGGWQDLRDLNQQESNEEGIRIRKLHLTLLQGGNISETIVRDDSIKSSDKGAQKSIQEKEFKKILEHHQKLIENKKLQVRNPGGNNISDPMNGKPYDPDHFKNYQGDTKNTYLMWEIGMGYNDFVSEFLDFSDRHKLDIGLNSKASGFFDNTALHIAVAKGYSDHDGLGLKLEKSNLELVKKLIDLGADPNIINKQSKNQYLAERGLGKNYEYNCTPLDLAVARGDIGMVTAILESPKMRKSTLEQAKDFAENKDYDLSLKAVRGALEFRSSSGFKVFAEIDKKQYQENKEAISNLLQSKLQDFQEPRDDSYTKSSIIKEGRLRAAKKVSFEGDPIEIKREIEAKIFVDPEGGSENLSAEDVAIRKFVGDKKELVEEKREKWSEKESGEKESVLEYAAKGVFNKALKAEENLKSSSRNTVKGEEWGQKDSEEWKKKSQEVWYDRFVRTDFKGVDLSETFRTVFVNCTFDKNCVLPTEKSSIDPKYFSNCKFSKELMNKEENKKLKDALSKAGMKDDREDSGFYKMDNEKDKKENPNPRFKPIESFQLIEGYAKKIR